MLNYLVCIVAFFCMAMTFPAHYYVDKIGADYHYINVIGDADTECEAETLRNEACPSCNIVRESASIDLWMVQKDEGIINYYIEQ